MRVRFGGLIARVQWIAVSETFAIICELVAARQVQLSMHGYDELINDNLLAREILAGIAAGVVVDDYPDYHKGACALVLQKDQLGNPVHVVWGLAKGTQAPAILVTAYRPDPARWADGFTRRLK